MNPITKRLASWMQHYPKARPWLWFVVLWMGGLGTVMLLTYPLKLLLKAQRPYPHQKLSQDSSPKNGPAERACASHAKTSSS